MVEQRWTKSRLLSVYENWTVSWRLGLLIIVILATDDMRNRPFRSLWRSSAEQLITFAMSIQTKEGHIRRINFVWKIFLYSKLRFVDNDDCNVQQRKCRGVEIRDVTFNGLSRIPLGNAKNISSLTDQTTFTRTVQEAVWSNDFINCDVSSSNRIPTDCIWWVSRRANSVVSDGVSAFTLIFSTLKAVNSIFHRKFVRYTLSV